MSHHDEVDEEPTGPAKAEAVMESLQGPDEFGLTQPQKTNIFERFRSLIGKDKAHSIEFADGWSTTGCCNAKRVKVRGFRKPIEEFKRQNTWAVEQAICPNCGEFV